MAATRRVAGGPATSIWPSSLTPPSSSPSALAPRPAETPVVGYVRSSKHLHDVSCEAQAEQIRRSVQSTERLVSLPAGPQGIFEASGHKIAVAIITPSGTADRSRRGNGNNKWQQAAEPNPR
jgi:hypothetical protein